MSTILLVFHFNRSFFLKRHIPNLTNIFLMITRVNTGLLGFSMEKSNVYCHPNYHGYDKDCKKAISLSLEKTVSQ